MKELWATISPYVSDWLYLIPAIVISLTVHECSHAFAAYKLGDPTPKEEGRLSLNPLRHIDVFGFIVMLLAHFGWAKPVRVNPMYFENPRKGMMLTAIAGPISNIIIAIVSSLALFMCDTFRAPFFLIIFFVYMTRLNIGLAIFNLIPIHPLDGSRIVSYFAPSYASFMARYGSTVQLIFFALLILPDYITAIPDILGTVIISVQVFVSNLLYLLWSIIFWFI